MPSSQRRYAFTVTSAHLLPDNAWDRPKNTLKNAPLGHFLPLFSAKTITTITIHHPIHHPSNPHK